MVTRETCNHEHARFHSIQRLGRQPPVELWQCPACGSTVAAESLGKRPRPVAAA